jgi:hypothetical protein
LTIDKIFVGLRPEAPNASFAHRHAEADGGWMPLSIVERDGRIIVSSSYHPSFPARARSLGGIWDKAQRVWVFDAADHDRVRSLCAEIYGPDALENSNDERAPFANSAEQRRHEFADAAAGVPHYYGHRRRLRERMIAAGAESEPARLRVA